MTSFPLLERLHKLEENSRGRARFSVLTTVKLKSQEFPVYGMKYGPEDPTLPTLGLFGGVHGLERVGSEVALYALECLNTLLEWDRGTQELLKRIRVVAIPLINPGGMYLQQRSNLNGVDLMRNAPVEYETKPTWLLGGHRFAPTLPWFKGRAGKMEPESKALVDFVNQELLQAPHAMSIDFHSGFGAKDRLWYPYAKSTEVFPLTGNVQAVHQLLNRTHPAHVYHVEPQSDSYTTDGDLWDYLFDEHFKKHGPVGTRYIPWTLEMGSWAWIKKNPLQIFQRMGGFNPIKPHRIKRVQRRHWTLVDFFMRVLDSPGAWSS